MNQVEFSELVGKTLWEIEGASAGSENIVLRCTDGAVYAMSHSQDCCERVEVEDITGDVYDLIGSPLLVAEESTSGDHPEGFDPSTRYIDSFTWTFYKLATAKGWVDIRWLGNSNGYYSERVDLVRLVAPTAGSAS